ncbi:MAG TPA: FGGY-family carbohydrate kinase [Acidimicrobiales bacterium]|nr:FGGY-family carbohydrate kinase [Acidimicrobiales bacterium]
MNNRRGPLTIGVDIGTTSVKALAVDEDGKVVAQSRIPHKVLAPEPHELRHDARQAWRAGPKKAYADLVGQLDVTGQRDIAGVTVAAMVPSLTAVNRRGVPLLPGLLYGDVEGRPAEPDPEAAGPARGLPLGAMADAEGFLQWALTAAPGAAGYWPCQAVATYSLSGVPAIDSAATASLGELHSGGKWNRELLDSLGVAEAQMPQVFPMCEAAGTLPGSDTVFTGGSIDALCDQIVAGATEPGDVLAIFGATLIVWVVSEEWLNVPDLISYPHTTPERFLIGGPSNAGALFVNWARELLRGVPRPGPDREKLPPRLGRPDRVPVWLPYVRGERTPFNDHTLRSSLHGLDIGSDGAALERAAYEASGFVIRRIIDRSGAQARRVVASGGGSRVTAWMSAVADATGLPVEAVDVPDGAARGAAFFARMAAGLENSLNDSARWAGTSRRIHPDPAWAAATEDRYRRFCGLGAGT